MFDEEKHFRFGDNSVSLYIKLRHEVSGFLFCEPPGISQLYEELIEEGVQLIDIHVAIAIVIIEFEGLIDEHSEGLVIKIAGHLKINN